MDINININEMDLNGPACPASPVPAGPPGSTVLSAEYEVYGQVQACYFPKYAKEEAEKRGIGGWIKLSKKGTVLGKIQGPRRQMEEMTQWLAHTGSPGSKIEKLELTNWEFLHQQEFRTFSIRF